jgi:hypothetical protein
MKKSAIVKSTRSFFKEDVRRHCCSRSVQVCRLNLVVDYRS